VGSDGYGDQLSVAELIERLEALNGLRAREYARPGAEAEDLAQEARIAIWEASRAHPGRPRAYYSAASAMRIREAAVRQTWTGHTRHHGQPTDPLRQPGKRSLDDPGFVLAEALAAPDWVGTAELAYHRGTLLAALNALPGTARLYVWRRFWCGWSTRELDQAAGGNSWRVWSTAKAQLQDRLKCLQPDSC
jgi:DNA-directed RNA polymerase specialized sigma24 family protein